MVIAKHISLLTESEKGQIVSSIRKDVDADVLSQSEQIRKGKHCYNYVRGNIFSDLEMAEIEKAQKVPVQATEGVVKISAIMGHLMKTSKDGLVVGNGPEDAATAEHRQTIIKDDIATPSGIDRIKFQVAQDVLVTGVPTWAFVDNTDPHDMTKGGLSVVYQPWDSVIPYGGWRDPNKRDLKRITRIMQLHYEDLSEKWFDGATPTEIRQYEQVSQSVANRDSIANDFLMARTGSAMSSAGMVNVFETLQFVYTEIQASVGTDPEDVIHLPLNYTPEQIQAHVQETGRQIVPVREKVLWSTIWTNTGLLLDHGPSWYQAGGFPAACFVPTTMDGHWCGVIEFTVDTLKMLSYLYTEQLQGVRTTTNNVTKMLKGAVKDKKQLRREMSRAGGLVEIEEGYTLDSIAPMGNLRENQAFNDAIASSRDILDRLTLERNAEGGAQASQESSKAIAARVDANLAKIGYFQQGFTEFEREIMRILVKALPYGYPDYRVVRLYDPENGSVRQEGINEPAEYDIVGNAVRLKNDLMAGEWDFVFTETDNSVSGREQARAIFMDFMKNFGNLPPEHLESVALSYPSTDVQKLGRDLKKAREAREKAPPPPPPSKVSFTADLSALGAEALKEVAVRENLISPPPPPPPPAQQSQGEPGPGQEPEPPMPMNPGGMPPQQMEM